MHKSYLRFIKGLVLDQIDKLCSVKSLDKHAVNAARSDYLLYAHDRTYRIAVLLLGIFDINVFLCSKKNRCIRFHSIFNASDGEISSNVKVHRHIREHHEISCRHESHYNGILGIYLIAHSQILFFLCITRTVFLFCVRTYIIT